MAIVGSTVDAPGVAAGASVTISDVAPGTVPAGLGDGWAVPHAATRVPTRSMSGSRRAIVPSIAVRIEVASRQYAAAMANAGDRRLTGPGSPQAGRGRAPSRPRPPARRRARPGR